MKGWTIFISHEQGGCKLGTTYCAWYIPPSPPASRITMKNYTFAKLISHQCYTSKASFEREQLTLDMCLSSLGPTSPYPSAKPSATAARRTAAPTSAVMCRILHYAQIWYQSTRQKHQRERGWKPQSTFCDNDNLLRQNIQVQVAHFHWIRTICKNHSPSADQMFFIQIVKWK